MDKGGVLVRSAAMAKAEEINVRPVEARDRSRWDEMWRGYLAFYETELPDATRQLAFERLLDPASKAFGLIAETGGQGVGLAHCVFHDHMWRPEGICYLQDLYADPACRGRGVGRALIKAVYDRADRAGIPRVYWLTQDFNETARRLYDRVGRLTPFIRYDRP